MEYQFSDYSDEQESGVIHSFNALDEMIKKFHKQKTKKNVDKKW